MKNKIKTKKAAIKRVKITGTGKLRRFKSGRRHLLEHEDPGKKRGRRSSVPVAKADMKKIKKMIPGI
jgi:large subunit ribosomal protein L35